MKNFNRIFCGVILAIVCIFIGANVYLNKEMASKHGRPYRVEISRIAMEIENRGLESVELSRYEYVTNIEKYYDDNTFYKAESDYYVCEIAGEIYRFDYSRNAKDDKAGTIVLVNGTLGLMALFLIIVLFYVRQKVLRPFQQLSNVPYELSKGNLTAPIKEHKSRFFGRFIWGVDLLRENMEQQKQRELDLQRDKKTLLLSISHDIKTPLSAIKLYSKALSKGLYQEKEKQIEIAENINAKADEIEGFVSQIIRASSEDFLSLTVNMGEFYLSELLNQISGYYQEKLALVKIGFSVGEYSNCLLKGDIDRSVEVLQNLMENAVKYGDGGKIRITAAEEEGCRLITVTNSGCNLADTEVPHIFESFWRGANAEHQKGSGLGLYICRQLMHKMNGDIFAEVKDGEMAVTVVFVET